MKLLSQIKNSENDNDFSHLLYYGEYATVNFLSMYSSKCKVLRVQDYSSVWKEEFGISDARLFHLMMIAEGYLVPSSIEERLSECSMEDICKIAEEIGLSTSGTKEEVLKRLELNAELDQISKFMPQESIFSLSEKGKRLVNANQDLINLYQKKDVYHVTYNEYASLKSKHKEMNFYDILWQVMTERFQRNADDTEYELVQNEYLNMYALLLDQEKKPEALNALLNYFFMDLNVFADTFDFIEEFKRSAEPVAIFLGHAELPQFHLSADIVTDIYELKESYDSKIAQRISENNVSYYVNTEAFLAILDEIYAQTFSLEDTTAKINERIPKALDHILRSNQI